VRTYRHRGRPLGDGGIDEAGVATRELVGIVAAAARTLAHLRIAQIREVRVVELHVGAACCAECLQLRAITCGHVGIEILEIWIRVFADRAAPAAKMQHRRRGNRHLRHVLRHRLQELEILELDGLPVRELARYVQDGRREVDAPRGTAKADRDPAARFDSLQLLEEVDMEERPAKFAVGDAVQAEALLKLHDLSDCAVFHRAQLLLRQRAGA
jgi:hypothetical protein